MRPYKRGTLLSVLGPSWTLTPGSCPDADVGALNTPSIFAVPIARPVAITLVAILATSAEPNSVAAVPAAAAVPNAPTIAVAIAVKTAIMHPHTRNLFQWHANRVCQGRSLD